MVKEKRILSYLLGWLITGYIILFIGTNNVFASTYDNFEVTWYYRNTNNESQLLNVLKQEDVPLYASTNEYVNGYTTRVEQTFTKQIQYIVNYQLQMWFSPEQELNYRSDTLQRIIDYSYVDSDFKVLNTIANENWNRSSGTGDTVLTINVSMQVLALNNTNAIRFGVYTNNNISIGFYNHSDYINYYLVNNISIEENANATIIDQNNQILNGQNNLQNSITNSQDNINQNIDDMEQNIIDSNNQTQDVIKDQFNECSDSINLWGDLSWSTGTYSYFKLPKENVRYILAIKLKDGKTLPSDLYIGFSTYGDYNSNNYLKWVVNNGNFSGASKDGFIYRNNDYNGSYLNYISVYPSSYVNQLNDYFEIQLEQSEIFTGFEEYGEICQNRIDETNDKLDNLQGALTDSRPTDMSGLGNSAGWLPAGPVDSILTLPLTMLNNLVNNLSSNKCQTAILQLPYVKKI